jgi:hypothetical protein
VSQGARPIDVIRRPPTTELTTSLVFGQRYFSMASVRILLSDTANDITTLPSVTAGTPPVLLDGDWTAAPPNNGIATYGPIDAAHPPIARSPGPQMTTTTGGSTLTTINVTAAGVPVYYRIPAQLTVSNGVITRTPVTCTGRTATTFTGCNTYGVDLPSAGVVVSAAVPLVSGWAGTFTPATPMTATWVNGNSTITVTSTAAFAPSFLFVNDQPATCTGYTPTSFINCSGISAAPGAGATVGNEVLTPLNTGSIGGFIKVERQSSLGVWTDVTMEILNLGIGARNQVGFICNDPTPNAVLRIQRLRDNGGPAAAACNYGANPLPPTYPATNQTDYWPNALYDTREGNVRDTNAIGAMNLTLGGVMHYVALDVNNLRRWLAGTIGATGTQAWNNNGYIVYFSDRRNNRDQANLETGEYGWEDIVNPAADAWAASGGLPDVGEDFNGNGTLETYGQFPAYNGVANPAPAALGTFTAPINAGARPMSAIDPGQARVNRPVLFRRALKLVNGTQGNLPASGLTVATENPIYVQGDYNATAASVVGASVPASVIGDSVTILSNGWNDSESFRAPNNPAGRVATNTGYRFAAVAGKGLAFPWPGWAAAAGNFVGSIFGTDGGVGNFLRYIEDWNSGGATILYRGSLVSLYTSRQATGTFKCCQNVYRWGLRNYSFDVNFLSPALLPPGTPMFRAINTLTFRQLLRPTE